MLLKAKGPTFKPDWNRDCLMIQVCIDPYFMVFEFAASKNKTKNKKTNKKI